MRENDPLVHFAGYFLLFLIATIIDVLRSLCSPVIGIGTLVLTLAAFVGWGLQGALDVLGVILLVIVLYHWSIAFAARQGFKS